MSRELEERECRGRYDDCQLDVLHDKRLRCMTHGHVWGDPQPLRACCRATLTDTAITIQRLIEGQQNA